MPYHQNCEVNLEQKLSFLRFSNALLAAHPSPRVFPTFWIIIIVSTIVAVLLLAGGIVVFIIQKNLKKNPDKSKDYIDEPCGFYGMGDETFQKKKTILWISERISDCYSSFARSAINHVFLNQCHPGYNET